MFIYSSDIDATFPEEVRSVAWELFPPPGLRAKKDVSMKAVSAYADALGIGEEYRRLRKLLLSGDVMEDILERFQNNLDLLIQKTWVEKAEELLKYALQDKVPPFIDRIVAREYYKALEEFGVILREMAYLFFGAQSLKNDFTKYTFRIDIQMGLFWWYGSRLGSIEGYEWAKSATDETLLAVLLLGICYLIDF